MWMSEMDQTGTSRVRREILNNRLVYLSQCIYGGCVLMNGCFFSSLQYFLPCISFSTKPMEIPHPAHGPISLHMFLHSPRR